MSNLKIHRISETCASTLTGMNGGNIESPDGKNIVYAEKADLTSPDGMDIMICSRDLSSRRKIYTVSCMNHNGPSASFVDNDTVVFRDLTEGIPSVFFYDIKHNVVKRRIYGKMGHKSEGGLFPFSVREQQIELNNSDEIKETGVYLYDIKSDRISFVISDGEINDIALSRGYGIKPNTCDVSHLQLNPECTSIMMRMGVPDCPVFGALGCIDLKTRKTYLIPDKPVHQLWYDNDTYMATRQFSIDGRIDMATSYIARFSKEGEELEVLGGIGNHIDGNFDRTLFAGDRCYPGYGPNVYVYEKGNKKPVIEIPIENYSDLIWKLQVHPNPSFSGDGKRLYFNRPVSESRTEASFIEL